MTEGDPYAYPLDDPDELLLRQVHHTWLHKAEGRLTSMAFQLFPKDQDGRVSTRREEVGPETAYAEWVSTHGPESSVGTWGVEVREVGHVGAKAYDDSHLPDQPPFHASIDYTGAEMPPKQMARKLSQSANARGPLHRGTPCTCHPLPWSEGVREA